MTADRRPPIVPLPSGTSAPALQGVLTSRVAAWLVDVVIVAVLGWLVAMAIALLGIITMGAGFVLLPLVALTGAGYSALTVGGPKQATLGMRMAGIRVVRVDGDAPDGLTAAVHALLFWVAAGTVGLLMLDLAFGALRQDRRLGHDLLVGFAVVRA
jgi:uncharacterized RDD family membrane protein YckC